MLRLIAIVAGLILAARAFGARERARPDRSVAGGQAGLPKRAAEEELEQEVRAL
jgi:hypothetical protein